MSPWAKIKMSASLCAFLEAVGKILFSYLPSAYSLPALLGFLNRSSILEASNGEPGEPDPLFASL